MSGHRHRFALPCTSNAVWAPVGDLAEAVLFTDEGIERRGPAAESSCGRTVTRLPERRSGLSLTAGRVHRKAEVRL